MMTKAEWEKLLAEHPVLALNIATGRTRYVRDGADASPQRRTRDVEERTLHITPIGTLSPDSVEVGTASAASAKSPYFVTSGVEASGAGLAALVERTFAEKR